MKKREAARSSDRSDRAEQHDEKLFTQLCTVFA